MDHLFSSSLKLFFSNFSEEMVKEIYVRAEVANCWESKTLVYYFGELVLCLGLLSSCSSI